MAQKHMAAQAQAHPGPGGVVVALGRRKTSAPRPQLASVKSAERVLRILEFFDVRRGPVAEIEIARALGFPQSSTSALLHTIAEMGYLHHDRQARLYSPSNRISMLGHWINDDLVRDGPLLELAGDLARYTGRSCIITNRAGPYIQVIDARRPGGTGPATIPVGARKPICLTVSGAVFLREATDNEVHKLILRSGADPSGGASRSRPDWFWSVLNGLRADSYAFGDSVIHEGQSVLSAPFGAGGVQREFALNIVGPNADMQAHRDRYARLMLDLIGLTAQSSAPVPDAGTTSSEADAEAHPSGTVVALGPFAPTTGHPAPRPREEPRFARGGCGG
jgi:DNA-binding IclR family transcriptional regulator